MYSILGILESRNSIEAYVVDSALKFVNEHPNLLPNTELKAQTYFIDVGVPGIRTIQAGMSHKPDAYSTFPQEIIDCPYFNM